MKPEIALTFAMTCLRAREALEGKFGTTDLESRDKYLWRPDLRPHLAEYVADFTLAGRHALGAPILASRLALFGAFFTWEARRIRRRARIWESANAPGNCGRLRYVRAWDASCCAAACFRRATIFARAAPRRAAPRKLV